MVNYYYNLKHLHTICILAIISLSQTLSFAFARIKRVSCCLISVSTVLKYGSIISLRLKRSYRECAWINHEWISNAIRRCNFQKNHPMIRGCILVKQRVPIATLYNWFHCPPNILKNMDVKLWNERNKTYRTVLKLLRLGWTMNASTASLNKSPFYGRQVWR